MSARPPSPPKSQRANRLIRCSTCNDEGVLIRNPAVVEHATWPESRSCVGCLLEKNLRALEAQGFTKNHGRSAWWTNCRTFAWKGWEDVPPASSSNPPGAAA